MNIEILYDKLTELSANYVPKILLALLTLFIGFWIIKKIINLTKIGIQKTGVDETLAKFISSLVNIGLKVMLFLAVAGMFGVNTTSFIAIISALMVGVGMAMNGMLGHLVSGIMIMMFKPFKVGDLVKIGGHATVGTVHAINAFNTTLKTLDNQRVIISNSNVTGNDINNISGQGTVGVELTFGIGYSDNIQKAREIILAVGNNCPYILDNPEQMVVVSELGDSSVNLATRPFCNSEHYWDTLYFMQEEVKLEFDKHGIGIPFPTMDVNLVKQN